MRCESRVTKTWPRRGATWPGDSERSGRRHGSRRVRPDFCATIIGMDREVRWFRSARRHRIGKAHAMHVIATFDPIRIPATRDLDARLVWVGSDDRGIELEIVALDLPEAIIVIHVMPTELSR